MSKNNSQIISCFIEIKKEGKLGHDSRLNSFQPKDWGTIGNFCWILHQKSLVRKPPLVRKSSWIFHKWNFGLIESNQKKMIKYKKSSMFTGFERGTFWNYERISLNFYFQRSILSTSLCLFSSLSLYLIW